MEAALHELLSSLGMTPRGAPARFSGGDIAAVYRLETDQGRVVVKHDDPERLESEAEGLRALREARSGLVVPDVIGRLEDWMMMEALENSTRSASSDTVLGEGLRKLHATSAESHGWERNNFCGPTPQVNTRLADGRAFQRERRLLPLAEACLARGLLDTGWHGRIERVAAELETWLPDAPARLVHGDLWSGNVLHTPHGPALIDPAVYGHYPEVDLAMLTLFGSPGEAFFEAYWDGKRPEDWSRREALFQLYPLLNHLLLFGGGYRSAVERAVERLEG